MIDGFHGVNQLTVMYGVGGSASRSRTYCVNEATAVMTAIRLRSALALRLMKRAASAVAVVPREGR